MVDIMVHVSTLREDDGTGRLVAYLERPPLPGRGTRQLGCTVADFPLTGLPGAVRQAGETLYARLALHPEFNAALIQALGIASDGRCPIFVHLDVDGEADRIPWETICDPTGNFFGLERQWSVARVVDSKVKPPGTVAFRPPLRIAVLLSCLDVPAAAEWAGLKAAVEGSPIQIKILALVGEPELEQQIADEGRPDVIVQGIPGPEDLQDLRGLVAAFRPHILHFFCHGSLREGAHLELATQVDWMQRALGQPTVSSLFLEPSQVAALGDPVERTWLVVLNCCEGAAAEGQIHSLASDLVYAGGIPAVVGMREPIASDDASKFSARFYPDLFAAVERIAAGAPAALDWSGLLVEPRRSLVERPSGVFSTLAAERREWTLPVLYLRPDEFLLANAAPPAPADPLLLEILRIQRATAPEDSPPAYLAHLDRQIAEIERRVAGP